MPNSLSSQNKQIEITDIAYVYDAGHKMAEAVRPVKKKRKTKKSHPESRKNVEFVGEDTAKKKEGIARVDGAYAFEILLKRHFRT